jgi:asparagine synthase (glutamine-hydrolysing)
MANSLEIRVPYLDVRLIDVALSLPDETKLGDLQAVNPHPDGTYLETGAKRVLIDAGRHLLPEGIDRQAKRGFGMPFDAWLRGPLRDVLDDALSIPSLKKRGFFDVREVQEIRKRFLEGQLSWVFPWLLIVTELWCREVLDRSLSGPVN